MLSDVQEKRIQGEEGDKWGEKNARVMELGGVHEALAKTERGSAKGRTREEGGKEGRKASVRKDGTNGVEREGGGKDEGVQIQQGYLDASLGGEDIYRDNT